MGRSAKRKGRASKKEEVLDQTKAVRSTGVRMKGDGKENLEGRDDGFNNKVSNLI